MQSSKKNVSDIRGYVRLDRRLSLLAWLHNQTGFSDTKELLSTVEPTTEGFDADNRSFIYSLLASRVSSSNAEINLDQLLVYDENIRSYMNVMNSGRETPITLRYFQYLAVLYSEIYLDSFFSNSDGLLKSLNQFVEIHNSTCAPDVRFEAYVQSDLRKLAFWMATGSGKTLLLHLNYLQFIKYLKRYGKEPLHNILLITPNEGLTLQHINELHASNIDARRFEQDQFSAIERGGNVLEVTEITKIVMEKRGDGDSVPVEMFEGNNLILVDEGHRGAGGEVWREVRDALAKTGFTFEYSATFGQALGAIRDDSLLTEYGKSIVFDYSYRHFYDDGYGKDFQVLNLKDDFNSEWTDTILLANLLSFYQQQLIFVTNKEALKPYDIERPLWVFVGSSVNAVFQSNKRKTSDVLTVVRFLHRVLSEKDWCIDTMKQILYGYSGLTDEVDGKDIFHGRFEYLNLHIVSVEDLYENALKDVLHTSASGLKICDLHMADGELGIKGTDDNEYFGVINIGDTNAFKKLVESEAKEIVIENDYLSDSLFNDINEPGSKVEVLIGSRKFIEGWNSWRVSNMGLLNIGKGEGSQIIQLFGRGVRLRGLNMSLKRSSSLVDSTPPPYTHVLETLNIFAIRANYMSQFREYLESEGIRTDSRIELSLPIKLNKEYLDKGLLIPRLPKDLEFGDMETVMLEPSDFVINPVTVDLSPTLERIVSERDQHVTSNANVGQELTISSETLSLVDWSNVYLALLVHKMDRGYHNLVIQQDSLREILEYHQTKPIYRLIADPSIVTPNKPSDCERLVEVVINILRKYTDALFRRRKLHWESNNLRYRTLDETDPNFNFNADNEERMGYYKIILPRDQVDLAREIQKLISMCSELSKSDEDLLPQIHFDRHLYLPLLSNRTQIEFSPSGLNDGECKFIEDLRSFCASDSNALPNGSELFVLRNLTKGSGVGFFNESGFFPDFILWIKSTGIQRIVFVEPHGLFYEAYYDENPKLTLHESLADLSKKITSPSMSEKIELDSYIVSTTPFQALGKSVFRTWDKKQFIDAHIEFLPFNDGFLPSGDVSSDGYYDYLRRILLGVTAG